MIPMHLERALQERTIDYRDRAIWLWSRFPFCGASELAGALGLSGFANLTPFSVWDRHTGEPPSPVDDDDQPEFLKWGHRMEAVILEEFQERHPELHVERTPPYRVTSHPVYPLIRGTPDGLCRKAFDDDIEGAVRPLVAGWDAKNVGSYRKHEFEDEDTLPADILIQGSAYCEIFDVPVWYFSILIGGNEYREFEVHRDTEFIEGLFVQLLDWWGEYVTPEPPVHPPADGSKTAGEMLAKIYGDPLDKWLDPTTEGIVLTERLKDARDQKKTIKAAEALYAQQLQEMAGATLGMKGVFAWKPNKDSVKVDWEAAFNYALAFVSKEDQRQDIIDKHTFTKPGARPVRIIKPPKRRGNWK